MARVEKLRVAQRLLGQEGARAKRSGADEAPATGHGTPSLDVGRLVALGEAGPIVSVSAKVGPVGISSSKSMEVPEDGKGASYDRSLECDRESGYQELGFQESGYEEPGFQESGYEEPGFQESGCQEPDAGVSQAFRALSLVALRPEDVGREVALSYLQGDLQQPVIVGLVQNPAQDAPVTRRTPVRVDGESLVVAAQRELVLQCGDAKVVLKRNGDVEIHARNLHARAKGVHRIRGGVIRIN